MAEIKDFAFDRKTQALVESLLSDIPEDFPAGLSQEQLEELIEYKERRQRKRERDRRYRRSLVGPIILLLVGIVCLMAPVVMDMYESWKAMNTISSMEGNEDRTNDPSRLYYLEQANRYNQEGQAGRNIEFQGGNGILPYAEQLCWNDYPAIGWLQISKINLKMPIYHYSNEEGLLEGVGHLSDTSLPVGGPGTRCVLTGHSGMTDKRMFDDVRKLKLGDTFVVWSLDEPHAYQIYDIQVVLPHETEGLKMEPGQDLCTLVTCTPYGVNSHRLLVTGFRVEYVPDDMDAVPIDAYINNRTVPLALGIILVVVVLTLLELWLYWRRKRRKKRELEEEEDALLALLEAYMVENASAAPGAGSSGGGSSGTVDTNANMKSIADNVADRRAVLDARLPEISSEVPSITSKDIDISSGDDS